MTDSKKQEKNSRDSIKERSLHVLPPRRRDKTSAAERAARYLA
jgi:hypothetical protein